MAWFKLLQSPVWPLMRTWGVLHTNIFMDSSEITLNYLQRVKLIYSPHTLKRLPYLLYKDWKMVSYSNMWLTHHLFFLSIMLVTSNLKWAFKSRFFTSYFITKLCLLEAVLPVVHKMATNDCEGKNNNVGDDHCVLWDLIMCVWRCVFLSL